MKSIEEFGLYQDINLSERERDILLSIINLYIMKATPVGSRPLSKYLEGRLHLSPASLRNIMADLEDLELITHPHTSAGRIPTDKGYRFYVNALKKLDELSNEEINKVKSNIDAIKTEPELVLKEASKILGSLSRYLAIVRIPQLINLVVQKLELVQLSSTRLLLVLALDSNIIKTVTIEADISTDLLKLTQISSYINEKISGRTLKYVKENFGALMQDLSSEEFPLIRLFMDSADKIFELRSERDQIITSGTQHLLQYPEFEDLTNVRGVIELIEDEEIIIHLLENFEPNENLGKVSVKIGSEIGNSTLENYSILTSSYKIGSAEGYIGLIGPKRMNYAKMLAIVNRVASTISE